MERYRKDYVGICVRLLAACVVPPFCDRRLKVAADRYHRLLGQFRSSALSPFLIGLHGDRTCSVRGA